MDIISWLAILAAFGLLVVVGIVDHFEQKRDPSLHRRMPGAIFFAAALLMGALLRG